MLYQIVYFYNIIIESTLLSLCIIHIARFIEKSGEGLHHIAFEVDNIDNEIKRLEKEGFTPLQNSPFKGADNKWVAFFHPKDAHGLLVEICQEIH